MDTELIEILKKNGKIAAITRLRQLEPKASLAEAKEYIEHLQEEAAKKEQAARPTDASTLPNAQPVKKNPDALPASTAFGCFIVMLIPVLALVWWWVTPSVPEPKKLTAEEMIYGEKPLTALRSYRVYGAN